MTPPTLHPPDGQDLTGALAPDPEPLARLLAPGPAAPTGAQPAYRLSSPDHQPPKR